MGPVMIARSFPFEQALVRKQQASKRAQGRIQAVNRFVRESDQGESTLLQTLNGGVRGCGEVLSGAHVGRFAQHIQQTEKARRNQQDAEYRHSPEQR